MIQNCRDCVAAGWPKRYCAVHGTRQPDPKKPVKRIFDDPNHPHYGPVRRMWVVLVQLDMLDTAERCSKLGKWDEALSRTITTWADVPESNHQRALLEVLLTEPLFQ